MNITIRRALKSDVGPLSELAKTTYANAFGHSLNISDLAAHLEDNLSKARFEEFLDEDTILIAELGQCLVGFIQIGQASPEINADVVHEADAELRRVYVLSEFQGRGVGRRLIDAALDEPVFRCATNICLDVWEDNQGAQKLYRSYGFRVVGKRAFEVRSGAETGFDLIMVRRTFSAP